MQSFTDDLKTVDIQDELDQLYDAGFGEIIDAILLNQDDCFFPKSGKMKMVGVGRALGKTQYQVAHILDQMRQVIAVDDNHEKIKKDW